LGIGCQEQCDEQAGAAEDAIDDVVVDLLRSFAVQAISDLRKRPAAVRPGSKG